MDLLLENLCDGYPLHKILDELFLQDIGNFLLTSKFFLEKISDTEFYKILQSSTTSRKFVDEQFRDCDEPKYPLFKPVMIEDLKVCLFTSDFDTKSLGSIKLHPAIHLFINSCSRGNLSVVEYVIKKYDANVFVSSVCGGFMLAIVKNNFHIVRFIMEKLGYYREFPYYLSEALQYDNQMRNMSMTSESSNITYCPETMIEFAQYIVSREAYFYQTYVTPRKKDAIWILKSTILYCLSHSDLATARTIYECIVKNFSNLVVFGTIKQRRLSSLMMDRQFKNPDRTATLEILEWLETVIFLTKRAKKEFYCIVCATAFDNERYDVLDWLETKTSMRNLVEKYISPDILDLGRFVQVTAVFLRHIFYTLCLNRNVNIKLLKRIETIYDNDRTHPSIALLLDHLPIAVGNENIVCVEWLLSLIDIETTVNSDQRASLISMLQECLGVSSLLDEKINDVLYQLLVLTRDYEYM